MAGHNDLPVDFKEVSRQKYAGMRSPYDSVSGEFFLHAFTYES